MRTILTYHAIDAERCRLSVEPDAFGRQLDFLLQRRIPLLTVSELLSSHRPGVALTFDDGFESVITTALPLMVERSITATVFPIIGALGRRIRWADSSGELPHLRLMSREAVAELAARGWEVGSHTLDHRCLVDLTDDELAESLTASRQQLQAMTMQNVSGLAYPNGCHTAYTRGAVAAAGYRWAVGTTLGQVRSSDQFRVRRVNIGQSTTPARFIAAFMAPIQVARRAVASHGADSSGHTHPVTNRTADYL